MVTVKREAEFFDEFYTQYETIESELKHYNFEGKSVYCNCDNYRESKFFEYFFKSFKRLGLKRLVSIGLMDAFYADITNPDELTVKPCTFDNTSFAGLGLTHKLLEECDIVVTNPPFSKWRIFYSIIKDKDFIILGNYNIINYPEVFRDILDDKLHFGYNVNQSVKFLLPDGTLSKSASSITWFTSFRRDIKPLKLTKTFNILDYPIINNYKYNEEPVINCNKVSDIPDNYYYTVAVPITFLSKWNRDQFEILGYSPYYNDYVERYENLYDNCIEYNKNDEPTGRRGNRIVTPVICSTYKPENCNYYKEINSYGKFTGRYLKVLYDRIFIRRKQ